MSVDFSSLPKPNFVDVIDFESIFNERKEYFISLYPQNQQDSIRTTLNRESEPVTKLLQENAYREMILRNQINEKALATQLAFAKKEDLDVWGANYDVVRLVISEANNTTTPPSPAIYEYDEDYRYRIQKKLDALSTAGPESAYEYHALSADSRVADVKCSSPAPAHALLTILQRDTENNASTPELNNIVLNYVSGETKRPTGDRVQVQSAEIIEFQVQAKLHINNVPETETVFAAAMDSISSYVNTSKRLGKGVYFSDLYSALKVTGVDRVELLSPTSELILTNFQAATCTAINLTIAGEE